MATRHLIDILTNEVKKKVTCTYAKKNEYKQLLKFLYEVAY